MRRSNTRMRRAALALAAGALAILSWSAQAQNPVPQPDTGQPVQAQPVPPPADPQTAPPADGDEPLTQAPPLSGEQPPDPLPSQVPEADGIALSPALPHDLSPWGMFMGADIVVKAVMVGLAFASLVTWTVWLAKSLELAAAGRAARDGTDVIVRARTLAEAAKGLDGRRGAAALLVKAALQEVALSDAALDRAGGEGLKERVASRLSRIEARAGRRMTRGTGLLATIGSTAPFVGLFGTVWGIMNAFIGISEAQTTNLAIVAPGIAEALLATALGLVAAIPAVVIYNVFARAIAGYRQVLGDASAGVERLVSRDLDYRASPRQAAG
jgi:biopolymer transport protein ExbB